MTSSPSASFLRRTAAWVIDAICACFPLLITSPVAFAFWHNRGEGQLAADTIVWVNAALSVLLYYGIMGVQLTRRRRTLGKTLLKLDVQLTSEWPTTRRVLPSLVWTLLCIWTRMYPLLLLPAALGLLRSDGRSPFDALAGLTVVRAQADTAPEASVVQAA